jgi:hypothetical protein
MSYGVMAYAVRESLWTALGHGDPALAELSRGSRADGQAESLDELLQMNFSGDATVPDAREALRQLLAGEPLDQRIGFVYAYWVEHFCSYELCLPSGAWMPIRGAWFDTVQQGLERAGVIGVSVNSLVMSGLPVRLPRVDDFPLMGCTSRAKIPALFEAFGACDLSAVPDPQVRDSIAELRAWLSLCTGKGLDLVCFYH